ncbi:hypothetical protein C1I98_13800 [Spongiactinospora gelatinilytica]|uniref:Uncharacterized protein n=1 Tax=Spongiactinospora gelatinilytica TaxID=2666298 RepID=A0A2W2GWT7_9ACTN|nr:hypothetical protein C1I98_13800 [Spongiactinospora gelatinilytica]
MALWATFVEQCEQGYSGEAEDYFNDLTVRADLEKAMTDAGLQKFPELAQLRAVVVTLDERFRALLLPDAFPRMQNWWARGVVKSAKRRLVEELRRDFHIEGMEVK